MPSQFHPEPVAAMLGFIRPPWCETGPIRLVGTFPVEIPEDAFAKGAAFVATWTVRPDGCYEACDLRHADRALVIATVDAGRDREPITERVPVGDVWKLAAAGRPVLRLSIHDAGLFAVAWAQIEHGGTTWTVCATDGRGAPAALVSRDDLFHAFLPDPHASALRGRRRSAAEFRELNRARVSAQLVVDVADDPSTVKRWQQVQTIAASSAFSYLDAVSREPRDRGYSPLTWSLWRDDDLLAWGPRLRVDASFGRLAQLRSRAATSLSRDVSGRARITAQGSTRSLIPADDGYWRRRAGTEALLEPLEDYQRAEQHMQHKYLIEWRDPTGNEAVELANQAQVLIEAGLSERQAEMLALRYFDWTFAEIANRCGCSERTARNTVATARRKIKRIGAAE